MEFETRDFGDGVGIGARVNLLRWSLKLVFFAAVKQVTVCKFTPMEFETNFRRKLKLTQKCKFTPMEFETLHQQHQNRQKTSVNLLRWSLKRYDIKDTDPNANGVNLLRWSLKPKNNFSKDKTRKV